MAALLKVRPEDARVYMRLFVNRRAYTLQSARPNPESGRHHYFRPKVTGTGKDLSLTFDTVRCHLQGEITVGLYAINPATQRSKWVAIDADYEGAMEDLLRLQYHLPADQVDAALEMSKRGGHLWIFMATPTLARECRIYIYNLALKLGLRIKGNGLADGIEIFPKHDELRPGEFGNAIRGPLGIHLGARRRYWFYGADYELEKQIEFLKRLRKLSESQLRRLIAGETMPPEFERRRSEPAEFRHAHPSGREFRILEHVGKTRTVGRNYVTQCPSCADAGQDRSRDNPRSDLRGMFPRALFVELDPDCGDWRKTLSHRAIRREGGRGGHCSESGCVQGSC